MKQQKYAENSFCVSKKELEEFLGNKSYYNPLKKPQKTKSDNIMSQYKSVRKSWDAPTTEPKDFLSRGPHKSKALKMTYTYVWATKLCLVVNAK